MPLSRDGRYSAAVLFSDASALSQPHSHIVAAPRRDSMRQGVVIDQEDNVDAAMANSGKSTGREGFTG